MTRLAIFDCEGTLTDSAAAIIDAMQRSFADCSLPAFDEKILRTSIGKDFDTILARLLPEQADNIDLTTKIATLYQEHFTRGRNDENLREKLFTGIAELLEKLSNENILLAIITAKSRRGLDYTLSHNHIKHYFTITHSANDGVMKPDPDILKQTMRELGASPNHSAMIGDTSFDIEMAKNAGAIPIGVSWGYHTEQQLKAAGAIKVVADSDGLFDFLMQKLR